MNSPPAAGQTILQLSHERRKIRDYTLNYSSMDIRVHQEFTTVFPRTGYLILSFITGTDFISRFANYDQSVARPNHLYVSGLFSESSLVVQQTGVGGGYALKLHPVIAYHFLKRPLWQLTDRQVRLCEAVADHGLFLEGVESSYLVDTFDHPQVIQFFLQALPPKSLYLKDPIYHAVNDIAESNGIVDIHRLSKRYFMTERTLHRHFLQKVGLSPKAYAKIWQVEYAMKLIRRQPEANLEQISFAAGYYDGAHLARDFKQKVSLPPMQHQHFINPLSQQYLEASSAFE